jgi:uncharacterized protein
MRVLNVYLPLALLAARCMVCHVSFEFDPIKSESNKAKHGIDFVEAQELWTGIVFEIPAVTTGGETRYAVLGEIKGAPYTVVITYRGASIRIISARASGKNEAATYANYKKQIRKT